jgi:hypothetical protein
MQSPPLNNSEIMKIIQEHPKIKSIKQSIEFNTYFNRISSSDLFNLQHEFPDLISTPEPENIDDPNYYITSVNLISKRVQSDGTFRKIRFYIDHEGRILRILDSAPK